MKEADKTGRVSLWAGSRSSRRSRFPRQNIFQFKVERVGGRRTDRSAVRCVDTRKFLTTGRAKGGKEEQNSNSTRRQPSTEDGLLQGYRLHSNCLPCRLLLLSQVASFDIFLFGCSFLFLFESHSKEHSWPLSAADDSTDSKVTAADGPDRHMTCHCPGDTAEMANDNPLGNVVKIIFITRTTKRNRRPSGTSKVL